MKRAVGYCRFSSSSQREESIDAQLRAIKDFCEKNNYELVKVYKDEGISGTSIKDREDFLKLIEDSKKNYLIMLLYISLIALREISMIMHFMKKIKR